MRTMPWEEIDRDWNGLQKRHRMEIAQAVARYMRCETPVIVKRNDKLSNQEGEADEDNDSGRS